jgi:2-dehydro-3-deoxyphosphogluconate aldolase / (4S)-4-hydroxy-2-oxoglutarate aldolase
VSWTPDTRAAAVDAVLDAAAVLPVLTIERLDQALPLAQTLVDAGLPVLEVTLRHPAAVEAIRLIASDVPGVILGAGTVLDAGQLAQVTEAGARFAISPGATDALYAAAAEAAIPLIPAVATASDIMRGLEHGHRRFKFFPAAAAGGIAALKAFAGPFPQVRFCPTGGIDAASAPHWLALSNIATVGGSWMVPADALRDGDWPRIADLARRAAALRPQPL